jgi:hypothetical protein
LLPASRPARSAYDASNQASSGVQGYKSVARHFAAIDQDKKGYITEDDIRAYYKTQRALHHQSASAHHTPNG